MNILVVDDYAINRRLLRAQLEAEGHAILEAGDGVEALSVLEREPVDAVISDILMPNLDGFGLCHAVRRHARFAALPFIIYTATYTSPTDMQLAHNVGADRYVTKPATVATMLEALRDAVRRASEHRPASTADEAVVFKQYNAALVGKLEEKNVELQNALEELERAHARIAEQNRDLERRVTARTADLEAANQELEAFSYSVSHDLRAPLRHINGFARMLGEHATAALDEKGRRYLATIRDAATQMGRLIDDLLAFSRNGRSTLAPAELDHDTLLAQVIRDGRYEAEDRTIVWEIAPLRRVVADPAMLRQVWANLLDNAVKYTRHARPARITVTCETTDGAPPEHIFGVRDNGVGFDPRYADKLFGVFQRLHDAGQFEGTGIGLANVRRIVTRHGGRTWAAGCLGAGAAFFFTLPVIAGRPVALLSTPT